MFCNRINRAACHLIRDFYVENNLHKYISIMNDAEYLKAIGMTKADARKEIAFLWKKQLQLSQFDEIQNGKRVKKVKPIFFGFLSS
jgi:GTPase Era involved in 16S rRNA processing